MLTQPNPRDCRWMSEPWKCNEEERQTESRMQKSISNTQKDKDWMRKALNNEADQYELYINPALHNSHI